jgi:hypothetical protein
MMTPRDPDHCDRCHCLLADHFTPDLYDPRNRQAAEDGHLNTCGDCGECYDD